MDLFLRTRRESIGLYANRQPDNRVPAIAVVHESGLSSVGLIPPRDKAKGQTAFPLFASMAAGIDHGTMRARIASQARLPLPRPRRFGVRFVR